MLCNGNFIAFYANGIRKPFYFSSSFLHVKIIIRLKIIIQMASPRRLVSTLKHLSPRPLESAKSNIRWEQPEFFYSNKNASTNWLEHLQVQKLQITFMEERRKTKSCCHRLVSILPIELDCSKMVYRENIALCSEPVLLVPSTRCFIKVPYHNFSQ